MIKEKVPGAAVPPNLHLLILRNSEYIILHAVIYVGDIPSLYSEKEFQTT